MSTSSEWDAFVAANSAGSFLQSTLWSIFQKNTGKKTLFLACGEKEGRIQTELPDLLEHVTISPEKWVFASSIIEHALPQGKRYLYMPRGPLCDFLKMTGESPSGIFRSCVDMVRSSVEKGRTLFLRVDPEWQDTSELREFFANLGAVKAPHEVQPQRTVIVDMRKGKEELLAHMHPKTRYNVRLSERRGVRVRKVGGDETRVQEEFFSLLAKTAQRDGFKLHPPSYYQTMLAASGIEGSKGGGSLELFVAEYNTMILAGAIVSFFGRRATYLHGASADEMRNVMGPYLLHWEIIKEAKQRGYEEYDLWGVSSTRWPGVTRFKQGFGGREVSYIGAYDFIFNSLWYQIYKGAHMVRRMR